MSARGLPSEALAKGAGSLIVPTPELRSSRLWMVKGSELGRLLPVLPCSLLSDCLAAQVGVDRLNAGLERPNLRAPSGSASVGKLSDDLPKLLKTGAALPLAAPIPALRSHRLGGRSKLTRFRLRPPRFVSAIAFSSRPTAKLGPYSNLKT